VNIGLLFGRLFYFSAAHRSRLKKKREVFPEVLRTHVLSRQPDTGLHIPVRPRIRD